MEVEGLDGLAVADDRHPVGHRLDLIQLVADDDRGNAVLPQSTDQTEQMG